MPAYSPEFDPKVQLGELLRLARDIQHKTQQDVAEIIGMERSTVAKGETGKQVPTARVLGPWLDGLGVTGLARTAIERMHRVARFLELDPSEIQSASFYETEGRAHTVRYWAPIILPGIVQTPAYATALFGSARMAAATLQEKLDVRLGRQTILERADAPDVTIIIWEPVLHHQIGTRQVMGDQCARLLDISEMPSVALHVLPAGANPGLGGAIQLAATDDGPELLLSDSLVEDQLSSDPAKVRRASATFNTVRADAYNRAGSKDKLTEAMETWRD